MSDLNEKVENFSQEDLAELKEIKLRKKKENVWNQIMEIMEENNMTFMIAPNSLWRNPTIDIAFLPELPQTKIPPEETLGEEDTPKEK